MISRVTTIVVLLLCAATAQAQTTCQGNGCVLQGTASLTVTPFPVASPAPTSLSFGTVTSGQSSAGQIITVSNTSATPLTILSIVASSSYSRTTTCPVTPSTLAGSSSCTVTVTFSPLSIGSLPGTLTLTDNASTSPQVVSLSGTGGSVGPPVVLLSPTSLVFGNVVQGANSTLPVSLQNTGASALLITSIVTSAQYSQSNNCGASVGVGITCTINVTFSPASIGSIPGTLTITDNASGSPHSVTLSGNGVAPSGNGPFLGSGVGWHDMGALTKLQTSQGVDVNPAICPPGFSSGCHNVWQAWSGAALDDANEQMLIFGGGHSDYGGNEVYALKYGQTTPALARLTTPTTPTATSGFGYLPEAASCPAGTQSPTCSPNSRHTYGGIDLNATNGQMYIAGGSIAPTGFANKSMFSFNPTTQVWTRIDSCGAARLSGQNNDACPSDADWPGSGIDQLYMNWDTVNQVFYVFSPNGCFYKKFNPSAAAGSRWISLDSGNCSVSGDAMTVLDPVNRVYLIVGAGGSWSYPLDGGTFNLTSRSAALGTCSTSLNSSGSNGGGPGLAYDPIDKLIVGYPVNGGNTVYLMNLATFTCSTEAQSGGPTIPNDGTTQGLRGRFRYSAKEDAFIWSGSPYSNAFYLRRRTFAVSDFNTRCAASGVLRCDTFDNTSDFVSGTNYETGTYPSDNNQRPTQDTSTRASGRSALQFLINASNVFPFSANPAGLYKVNFGTDGSPHAFREGETLYFQFRWRIDSPMTSYNWPDLGGQGWKTFIIFGPVPGASCTGDQFVQENTNQNNILFAYASCGSPSLVTNNGNPPYLYQQGEYACPYGGPLTAPNCYVLPTNTWITEYWKITVGTYGTASTHWESWVASQGQPLKKWLDLPNFVFNNNPDNHTDGFQQMILQPYFSGAGQCTINCPSPTAHMWFDEVIVSQQPIASPQP